jgi:tyrosyl-tRNA synthetase
MVFFSKKLSVITDEKRVDELLSRGVSEVIVENDLRKKLLSGERLRIKLGIDPTSPDLHIGRAVPLLKLRDFQELGHQIVFIVGDFTAVIGDTSDKDAERPMLSSDVIEKNKKTYFEQAGKILDLSQVELRYNSEWLGPLTYREIGEHADLFSVADFIARENIAKRLVDGKRVSLREILYPLMQGYDSVAVRAGVELGGTDQKFNVLAGRPMQEHFGQQPQNVVLNPLIDGLDGTKMSSSRGNYIALTAPPDDMYGKVMSMHDNQIVTYFEVCTRVDMAHVEEIKKMLIDGSLHPKEAKMQLAREIVTLYHSTEVAKNAERNWVSTFSEGGVPTDIPEITVARGTLFFEALAELGESKTELRRLIAAGAVSEVGGDKIMAADQRVEKTITLRVGKHRFLRIIVK